MLYAPPFWVSASSTAAHLNFMEWKRLGKKSLQCHGSTAAGLFAHGSMRAVSSDD